MPEFNQVIKNMESHTKEKTQSALKCAVRQGKGREPGVRESLKRKLLFEKE